MSSQDIVDIVNKLIATEEEISNLKALLAASSSDLDRLRQESKSLIKSATEEQIVRAEQLEEELSVQKNEYDHLYKSYELERQKAEELAKALSLQTELYEQTKISFEQQSSRTMRLEADLVAVRYSRDEECSRKELERQKAEELAETLSLQVELYEQVKTELQGQVVKSQTLEEELLVQRNESDRLQSSYELERQKAEELAETLSLQVELYEQVKTELQGQVVKSQTLEEELLAEKAHRDLALHQSQEALSELEVTSSHLRHQQQELEYYFLESRSLSQLVAAQQDQLLRAQALMARVLPEAAAQPPVHGLEVEVLPPLALPAAVQTEALLRSYASSLHRAASLLHRAMQR